MKTKTQKLTVTAMLCALAFVAVALCRIPVVLFLSYEPKDVIITLGGLIFGPLTACIVSVIVSLIEMMIISDTGIIGCIMNILSTCAFACTASAIYKKRHTLSGAVIGLISGGIVMTVVMILWNYLATPIYMGIPRETVAEMLIPTFLPFNLLKAGLNAGFTFMLYRPAISALRKMGFVAAPTGQAKKSNIGLILLFAIIIITCIMFILSFNGYI